MPSDGPHSQYWDSDVFISLLQKTEGRAEVLRTITDAAEQNLVRIVTSAFTMAEVVKLKELPLLDPEIEQLIMEFFENDYIVVRNVDRFVSERARTIVRTYNLKPPDAIQVATAILSAVEVMYTYDGGILKCNGRIDGFRIEMPRPFEINSARKRT